MSKVFIVIVLVFACCASLCQEKGDLPGTFLHYHIEGKKAINYQVCNGIEVKHREVLGNVGREYYCSGNLYATGNIVLFDSMTIVYPEEGNRERTNYTYLRNGGWQVYFDSTKRITRAEGSYKKGKEDGKWVIYSPDGRPKKEFFFEEGIVKTEISIDAIGNKRIIIKKNDIRMFFEHNESILLLLMFLFVLIIRSIWNMFIFYMLAGNQLKRKDALLAPFIFWWFLYPIDNAFTRRCKKTGNILGIISLVVFSTFMAFYI